MTLSVKRVIPKSVGYAYKKDYQAQKNHMIYDTS